MAESKSRTPHGPLGSSPFTVLGPGSPEGGRAEAGEGCYQDGWRNKARSQASGGPEVSRPPSQPQDTRVKYGEGGPPPKEPSPRRRSIGEQQGKLAGEWSLILQLKTNLQHREDGLRQQQAGASKVTAENLPAATEELRDHQDRLTGATAALIVAVREAGEGPMEEALLGWLEKQVDRVEDLKESLDQKRRELARLGDGKMGRWELGGVLLRGSYLPGELPHVEVKDMFLERGLAMRESKEGGTNGTMALLTLPDPEEALGALAVMHTYAPEGYKFKNATGLGVSFSSCKKQENSCVGAVERVMSQGPTGMGAGKICSRQEKECPQVSASSGRSVQEQEHPGAGSSRSRSVPDREPSDKTGCLALSPREKIQEEPQVPSSRIDTTDSRGKASSIGPETPGMVQGSTHRIEYRQLSFDGPDADFNPEVHAPTRPLFATEAEQLSLSLHQLLNNNRRRRDRVPANPHRTHVKIPYRPRGTQLRDRQGAAGV